ncbi:MAG: hypothetical protein ACXWDO_07150 [Bacteroidia bacterium]
MKSIYLLILALIISCTNKNIKEAGKNVFSKSDSFSFVIDSLRGQLLSNKKLHSSFKHYIRFSEYNFAMHLGLYPLKLKKIGDINFDGKPDSIFLFPQYKEFHDSATFTFSVGYSFSVPAESPERDSAQSKR